MTPLTPVFVVPPQTGLEVAGQYPRHPARRRNHGLAHRVTGADRDFTATLGNLRTLFKPALPSSASAPAAS